jgi:maltose/maltodextrin transport system substrate-binding protein
MQVCYIKPLEIKEEFKAKYVPMSWDAVTHKQQVWGYPVALESVSLVYNKKFVRGKVPTQLSELPAFGKELKVQNPTAIVIMWDYKTPYFS